MFVLYEKEMPRKQEQAYQRGTKKKVSDEECVCMQCVTANTYEGKLQYLMREFTIPDTFSEVQVFKQ